MKYRVALKVNDSDLALNFVFDGYGMATDFIDTVLMTSTTKLYAEITIESEEE